MWYYNWRLVALAVGGALTAVGLLIFGIVKLVECLVEAAQRRCGRKIEPEPDGESSSSSTSHPDVGQQPATQADDSTDDARPVVLKGEKVRMAFQPRTTA